MAFTDISFKQENYSIEKGTDNSDVMSLEDRMALWFHNEGLEEARQEEDLVGDEQPTNKATRGVVETEDEELFTNWLLAYREFVFSTEAYEWLLARLRSEFHLVPTEPNTIRAIGDKIMSSLPPTRRISRKVSPQSCSARFELDWDILEFFEMEEYLNRPVEVLEGIITLNGSCLDAQAATCAQYTKQTWPSAGELTLQLIKEGLRDKEGHPHRCKCSCEGLSNCHHA